MMVRPDHHRRAGRAGGEADAGLAQPDSSLPHAISLPRLFRETVIEIVSDVGTWLFPRFVLDSFHVHFVGLLSVDLTRLIKVFRAELALLVAGGGCGGSLAQPDGLVRRLGLFDRLLVDGDLDVVVVAVILVVVVLFLATTLFRSLLNGRFIWHFRSSSSVLVDHSNDIGLTSAVHFRDLVGSGLVLVVGGSL